MERTGNGTRVRRGMIGMLGLGILLPALLVGCGGSGGGGSSSTSPAASPAASSSETGGAAVIGPVILTPSQPDGEVSLGRTVVFNLGDDPGAWDLVTSDPAVLALVPGGTRDGATFNWGAETLSTGKASVVATPKGAGTPVTFVVSVVPA